MRRALLAAAIAAMGWTGAALAGTVNSEVFEANLLGAIRQPATLRYRYEMQGSTIDKPFTSHVDMQVRAVRPDGTKDVYFDLFEGPNQRHYGPVQAAEQNPLILVLLQRDVTQMGNLTGGASGYFQQQIRKAFTAPATSEAVTVDLAGQSVAATKVVIQPFRDDPNIARFPKFKNKSYEFVVAPSVPGGLYSFAARTPDPDNGKVILEESVTFQEVTPP